jgi:DNA polymerase III epsilon subunit-like protein
MKFHGISRDDLAKAPSFRNAAPLILSTLDGIVVGHSVDFDQEFLKVHFKRIGTRLKKEWIDIAVIEEWLGHKCGKPGLDLSLASILSAYGLDESGRHDAMADAFCVAQIFQMQMRRLADSGVDSLWTLKQVIKSCRCAVWAG